MEPMLTAISFGLLSDTDQGGTNVGGYNVTVTYPIAFSREPTIVATHETGNTAYQFCTLISPTKTQFKVVNCLNNGGVSNVGADFHYIAIGR